MRVINHFYVTKHTTIFLIDYIYNVKKSWISLQIVAIICTSVLKYIKKQYSVITY